MPAPVPDVDDNNMNEDGTSSGEGNGKVSYEAMFSHPEVKAVFEQRIFLVNKFILLFNSLIWADKFKLVYFCKLFLENIVSSLPTMPFGLRWIAKQLVVYDFFGLFICLLKI